MDFSLALTIAAGLILGVVGLLVLWLLVVIAINLVGLALVWFQTWHFHQHQRASVRRRTAEVKQGRFW